MIFFVASLTASAASAGKVVSLPALQKAAANDPYGPQGATTPGAVDSVKIVEAALVEAGFLTDNSYAYDGSYGTATIKAYQKWQRSLGSAERYCDGIPGKIDLTKLGEKYGFTVDTSIPDTKSQETKSATKLPLTPIKPTTKLPLTPIKPTTKLPLTPIKPTTKLPLTPIKPTTKLPLTPI
ncbi:MAG: hypothetical protein ACOX7Y_02555, partial [Methanosarcina sp.]